MMMSNDIYQFQVKRVDGNLLSFGEYRGQVLLVVNVASCCGFTPQYEGLEALYRQYRDRNFSVLGFPCNQFGNQEPGSDADIEQFCSVHYGVTFPILSKITVNGNDVDPLYQWLKAEAPGAWGTEAVKWNFTKFLVNRQGQVIDRFAPITTPKDLARHIEKALAE